MMPWASHGPGVLDDLSGALAGGLAPIILDCGVLASRLILPCQISITVAVLVCIGARVG